MKTVCSRCGALVREGEVGPGGAVSHAYCPPCLDAWRAQQGLPPLANGRVRSLEVAPASCGACLAIARRRGIQVGGEIALRNGHRGMVLAVSHTADRARPGVFVLVADETGGETVLLSLGAAADRGSVGVAA